MRSRANSFTACTARNRFTFFLRAICWVPRHSCCHSFVWHKTVIIVVRGWIAGWRCEKGVTSQRPTTSGQRPFMEERDFFDERTEKKMATLNCPHCHQPAEYEVTWVVRTKKRQLAGRADERDRARFAKARSYMLRKDDLMACKNMRCRKRFEISGVQSVVFTE